MWTKHKTVLTLQSPSY